ncbi:hypothetical protein H9P43_004421 [Blastocladiella emersonii ATCC 22665]|nr:hypothetical protein H9P43_004421 [Blastocladiella emersonii ATCC 22665]
MLATRSMMSRYGGGSVARTALCRAAARSLHASSSAPAIGDESAVLPPLPRTSAKSPAFVFDVDGVLVQGGRVLPEARRALAVVNGDNPRNVAIPHLYLTNGGGVTEAAKAEELAAKFGVPVKPEQVVLSHTPMRELAATFADRWVMAVGGAGNNAKRVLESYGFKKVVTPYEIHNWQPSIYPFCEASDAAKALHTPHPDFSRVDVSAILVLHDSRDWGTDLQIMVDVLRTPRGNLGVTQPRAGQTTPNPLVLAALNQQHVPIYFSNPDFLWANNYPVPRFGQRALRVALEAMWRELTGADLTFTSYGKPETNTYKYAYALLHQQIHDGKAPPPTHALDAKSIANCVNDRFEVYAVGDNPAADIEGAHRHGWHGLLVRTGVYQRGAAKLTVPTTRIEDHVEDAVKYVYERHYGQH